MTQKKVIFTPTQLHQIIKQSISPRMLHRLVSELRNTDFKELIVTIEQED